MPCRLSACIAGLAALWLLCSGLFDTAYSFCGYCRCAGGLLVSGDGMKRAVILYTVFALCIWGLNLRVALLSDGEDTAVYAVQSAKTITAAVSRGYFYDRDYRPLVNGTAVHMAAVIPYDGVEEALADNTDAASLALLQEGKPCVIPVYARRVNTQYIRYFDITVGLVDVFFGLSSTNLFVLTPLITFVSI